MEKDYMKSDMWGTCIWGIDDRGKLFIGDGVAANVVDGNAPWEKFKDEIVEVTTFGAVCIPKGASMTGLFKNCKNLEKADLKEFNTIGADDMSSMFEGCSSLTEVNLSSFNTSNVFSMNKMFSGCKALANLDLSNFDTRRVSNMTGMFAKCSGLHSIALSDNFSLTGDGTTSCGNLSVRDTGKYRIAKVVSAGSSSIVYVENYGKPGRLEKKSVNGMKYTIEPVMYPQPGDDYVFIGWNTQADGKGDSYQPGQEIPSLDDDLELFAIWVGVPRVGNVQPLAEVEYGKPIPFELPEIISDHDDSVRGYLEISPTGEEGSWEAIEHNAILSASYNGYLVRLCAKNMVGKAYSNAVRIRIKKAGIDISRVHWVESESMIYDGQPKSVWLEGLPEGVTAQYEENEAVEVGEYSASVRLEYDFENYNIPVKIRDHAWTINKAQHNMSTVRWNYENAFIYDGEPKEIRLTGLPEGVTASYHDNQATNAGVMTAIATLSYDTRNYEKPVEIIPCTWEIKKAPVDTKSLKWTDCSSFVYDGLLKRVQLSNLPADARVEYSGDEEVLAGKYLARANLSGNYYSTTPIEYEWEIKKAQYDMSQVSWSYTEPFGFNGDTHEIRLENLPVGLRPHYYNNIAVKAGDYEARASFTSDDTHNYVTPDDVTILWSIKKAVADMSTVRWDYRESFTFDGENKSVELTGLPAGVYATYENNNATNAGVYIAHANIKYDDANFELDQPSDCQWQINKARYDVSNVRWNYEQSFVYDGSEKSIGLINVPEGLNIEYKDNKKIDSGKYVASAKLTPIDSNNYESPEINGCTWSISKFKLDRGEIKWSEYDGFVYDGKEKSVRIISDIDEKIRVEYTGNRQVNGGHHVAKAAFFPVDTDNYEAPSETTYDWYIKKGDFDMKDVVWDYTSAFNYDGDQKSVKLLNVPEGLIVHYENSSASKAGKYLAVAKFEVMSKENYNDVPDMSLNWTIQKANYDMKNVRWQERKEFDYDGESKRIDLLGLPDGVEAVYENNCAINAAEYLASVSFKYDEENYEEPSYAGCRWKINKSDFDPGNARWDYEQDFVYDGTEKVVQLVEVPEGAHVEYSSTRATDAGIYNASAELIAEDSENYNDIAMEGITWKINKGEYDMSYAYWDYEKPFTYDGVEKKVVLKGLPEGVFPIYQNNTATDAGEYVTAVSFKIADTDNYNVPSFDPCKWKINKADYDMSSASWSYSGEFVYSGRMQEIVLRGLPEGVRPIYDGNCATNVGMYTATATLVPYDEDNYNIPTVAGCNWEIVKADYDMSAVRWDYTGVKIYNEREQGIELENLPNGVFAKYAGNDAIEVGKYTARASLRVADPANYNIPSVNICDWEIVNAEMDLSHIKWNYDPEQFIYNGSTQTVYIENLPEGVTAEYSGNTGVDAGQYVATAVFDVENKNYRIPESISFRWQIGKASCDMSAVKWDYGDELIYNGNKQGIQLINVPSAVKPAYKNNQAVDVGVYYAVASFIPVTDNYEAPEDMSCKWVINKANIDISRIRWDYDSSFEYDSNEKEIILAGVPDLLTVRYSGNKAERVGKYIAHAELAPIDGRNYNVPSVGDCYWEIRKTKYDMSRVRWVDAGPFTYDGSVKSVELEGLPSGVIPIYSNNIGVNAGEYTATAMFEFDENNYLEPSFDEYKWTIKKNSYDMSQVEWNYRKPFVYDGGVKSVALEGLPFGVTPIYTGNSAIDAGVQTASVEFRYDEDNYEQPSFESCRWEIEQAELAIDLYTLKWSYDGPFTYNGQVQGVALSEAGQEVSFIDKLRGKAPVFELVGVPDGVEAFYEDNEKTEVGVYFAKATLRHTTSRNYKEFIVPDCKWEIKKAVVDMSYIRWTYDTPFVYDGEEKSVRLIGVPEEVEVTYENNVATVSGQYEAQAYFELKDPNNYALPMPVKGCWWEIKKAKYDMSRANWAYDDDIVYNGKEKTVRVVGLPEGVKVEAYSGNKAIEAGSYTAEAIFKYKNRENYEAPEIPALRWKIQKKSIDTSEMRWTFEDSSLYVYDGKVKEVKLVGIPKEVEVVYINNSKINAGDYIARARLAYDTKNYEAIPVPDCKWSIDRATLDTTKVHWSYEKPFKYDSYEKSIVLRNVPSQIDVRYRDNKASAVGTYTAKAYLTYDKENYNPPEIDTTIGWEIIRMDDEDK